MALSKEDKKDVSNHMGKALANKVAKVTKDKGYYELFSTKGRAKDPGDADIKRYDNRKSAQRQVQRHLKKYGDKGNAYLVHATKANPNGDTVRKHGKQSHMWDINTNV